MMGSNRGTSFTLTLLSTLLIMLGAVVNMQEASECKVGASPVQEYQPTSITCLFKSDIGAMKSPMNVYRYYEAKAELIVSIMWPDKSSDEPHINAEKGYHVSGTVTTKVRIILDSTTTDHTGDYRCQVLSSNFSSEQRPCTLQVREKASVSTCDAKSFIVGNNAEITCHFDRDIQKGKDEILLRKIEDNSVSETVAHCVAGDPPVCHSFLHDGILTVSSPDLSSIKITILNAKTSNKGRYMCMRIASVLAERESPCDLMIAQQTGRETPTKIVVPAVVCVVVLLAAICTGICIYKRHFQVCHDCGTRGHQNEQDDREVSLPLQPLPAS